MCTYCGSGFILLICVHLYKQNRYRDTGIKGYVKGVKSSSIYPIRAVILCMSKVLKMGKEHTDTFFIIPFLIWKLKMVLHIFTHNSLNIQPIFIQTHFLIIPFLIRKLKMVLHIFTHNLLNIQPIFNLQKVLESCNLELSHHTIKCHLCWRYWRLFLPLTPPRYFNIHRKP